MLEIPQVLDILYDLIILYIYTADAWYFDGKKCDTLVKDTKYVNVQVSIIPLF